MHRSPSCHIAAGLIALLAASASYAGLRQAVLNPSHRSGSGVHKLVILDRDAAARDHLVSEGVVLRTIDYGGFALVFVDDATMGLLADPSLSGRVEVRDSFDLVALNGWTIDTRGGEPADLPRARLQSPALFDRQLYVVEFIGPMWGRWEILG